MLNVIWCLSCVFTQDSILWQGNTLLGRCCLATKPGSCATSSVGARCPGAASRCHGARLLPLRPHATGGCSRTKLPACPSHQLCPGTHLSQLMSGQSMCQPKLCEAEHTYDLSPCHQTRTNRLQHCPGPSCTHALCPAPEHIQATVCSTAPLPAGCRLQGLAAAAGHAQGVGALGQHAVDLCDEAGVICSTGCSKGRRSGSVWALPARVSCWDGHVAPARPAGCQLKAWPGRSEVPAARRIIVLRKQKQRLGLTGGRPGAGELCQDQRCGAGGQLRAGLEACTSRCAGASCCCGLPCLLLAELPAVAALLVGGTPAAAPAAARRVNAAGRCSSGPAVPDAAGGLAAGATAAAAPDAAGGGSCGDAVGQLCRGAHALQLLQQLLCR